MNQENQPLTHEMLMDMPRWDRLVVIKAYHKWLKKVRLEERRQANNIRNRVNKFKLRNSEN